MIRLGCKAKDKVTGYTGIAIGKTEWLNGCVRFALQPPGTDKDGKPHEAQWFDEPQLELVKGKTGLERPENAARPGGPKPSPSRQRDPRR